MTWFPLRPELLEKHTAERKEMRRALAWGWLGVTLMVGVNLWAPSQHYGIAALYAFLCCGTAVNTWSFTRRYRRLGMQMTGRAVTMVVPALELIYVIAPAKEGGDWKVIQWRKISWWNYAGQLWEPVGKGSSIARALLNLWGSLDSGIAALPSEERDALAVELDADFAADIAKQIERTSVTRVE